MNIFHELSRPFPEPKVHWRVGARTQDKKKGIPLAYIDARDVMERLDFVVGPQNWQAEYPFAGCCRLGIFLSSQWIWKANGAGETNVEAEKGQYSDAFKRAAVLWGIGRYLYDLPNVWVDLDQYGKFTPPKLPKWATPDGYQILPISEKKAIYEAVIEALADGDEVKLRETLHPYQNEPEDVKISIHFMFNSFQRAAIKEYLK